MSVLYLPLLTARCIVLAALYSRLNREYTVLREYAYNVLNSSAAHLPYGIYTLNDHEFSIYVTVFLHDWRN